MTNALSPIVTITAVVDGKPKRMATVRLENGCAMIEGEETFVVGLRAGVYHPLHKTVVMPEEGLAFLNALCAVYTNPYLFADLES